MIVLPPNAVALIRDETGSLGEPRAVFPLSTTIKVLGWGTAVVSLLMATAVPIVLSMNLLKGSEGAKSAAIGLAALFGVLGLGLALYMVYFSGLCFLVFRDALVKVHRGRLTILPWKELKHVWIEPTGGGRKFTVTTTAGAKVRFHYEIRNSAALGKTIESEMVNALRPSAERAIDQGETVAFGPLGVSQEGVHKGDDLLPWDELSEFSTGYNPAMRRWQLFIGRKGKLTKWFAGSTHKIPNLQLLTELVHRARPDLDK
jgi:hypothetical protein